MAAVRRSVLVRRDPATVFALVSDVDRYPEFLRGLTRWQPCDEGAVGVGSEFRVLMQVGSIEAGGRVRVVTWDEPACIAWRSVAGIDDRGRWRIEPVADGSRLTLEIDFRLEGPVRWLVERLAARIVDRNVQATLLAARRLLERPPVGGRRT